MLKIKKVSFAYDKIPVLNNINFSVEEGENISIIGSSGCGKSTLLQLIYGLHHSDGKIFWKEKELLGPKFNLVPGEPFIKYLAQDFDLMPPLSVEDNVGKYLSNMYPIKKKQRIKELLEVVEMEDLAKAKAKTLSGGQQQRVALARALANEPELLLLDEPFSHIDHFRKNNLRRRLFAYLKEQNITCLTATHDSTDALSFADKTIVLKNGKIHAKDTPKQLYNNPKDKYVASLFGDVNELRLKDLIPSDKSRKKVLLYPHEIKIVRNSAIKVKVQNSYFKGSKYLIKAHLNNDTIYFEHTAKIDQGKEVFIGIKEKLIDTRSGK
ncbi:ABC transporter ATP-binding protein [Gillisia limnaea]|uniref:ABC transporter related protein n=1 Tax=Gillisia limnaea (strain DSM 15749 / LMG 21470 / R-8282) TaxID=865937 RepID=H2BTQ9_GILLR|nr:ABC transporter ATP-binding protein [Gillisia limnaea]EHQ02679.1 ABC transporter related protein [Gillisia limnaea DSM 15749]